MSSSGVSTSASTSSLISPASSALEVFPCPWWASRPYTLSRDVYHDDLSSPGTNRINVLRAKGDDSVCTEARLDEVGFVTERSCASSDVGENCEDEDEEAALVEPGRTKDLDEQLS